MILMGYVGSLKLLEVLKTLKCEYKNKSVFESCVFVGIAIGTCYSNMEISYVNEGFFFQTKCYKDSSLILLQI